ncbi:hypothetical protein [Gemmatimonas sp.]|uniref:hypothetical protein n=1 Tax=Gemmatimonas sp. TaxID=1962908 RepID=UPI0025BD0DBC|nr:hypothetical protein [Gemmatimonas sp.]MCA2992492.1 hypothetical protein [Gemmatimonas sp.]
MPIPVSRETLYEEIWKEPAVTVAARYGVTLTFLARVCTEMNIPRPARGYWAKLAVNKAPKRPPLPPANPGDAVEWTRGQALRRERRALPVAPQRRRRAKAKTIIPTDGPHPVVADIKKDFLNSRGAADSGHLRPFRRALPDLYVSPDILDRALSVSSTLYRALEARGYRVAIARAGEELYRPALEERKNPPKRRDGYDAYYGKWAPDRPTVVTIGTVAIGLTIYEQSENTEVRYHDGKYVPVAQIPQTKRRGYDATSWTTHKELASGRLCLRASSPYRVADWEQQWEETTGRTLADLIPNIVRGLESAAPVIVELVKEGQARAEAERIEWERQRAVWAREEEKRRRERQIVESREQLAEIIKVWSVAKAREDFFEDLERRASVLPEEEQMAIRTRLSQARELLGGTDVLRRFASWRAPGTA